MENVAGLLGDYTFQTVAAGAMLLGLLSGALGCFAMLRRQSLLGDGISHASLPGVILAFLAAGGKHTEALLLGALMSGLVATGLMLAIVKYSRVKFDSALALVMSVFFGLGMVLLTYVQRVPDSNQAGLKRFVFGQAATLMRRDIMLTAIVGGVLLILLILFWKEFKLLAFDADFAQSLGFSARTLRLVLSAMIVLAIIVGLQTVGVILMSAMLIAPAVAARQWTNRLSCMVCVSALFGAVAGALGTFFSALTPKLPTGPSIVACVSAFVLISVLFAPGRGVFARARRHRLNRAHYIGTGGDRYDAAG